MNDECGEQENRENTSLHNLKVDPLAGGTILSAYPHIFDDDLQDILSGRQTAGKLDCVTRHQPFQINLVRGIERCLLAGINQFPIEKQSHLSD
jgi:hypothetical protein